MVAKLLRQRNQKAYKLHQTVSGPWGLYNVLEDHPGFKIKRIKLNLTESSVWKCIIIA